MSSDQTAKLLRHAPYFPVANVEQSLAFYEQRLVISPEPGASSDSWWV